MPMQQFEVWIAALNPRMGTESGKIRPVLILQTDLLTQTGHPSALACPITTKVQKEAVLLRVHIPKGIAGLKRDCDVMIDQIRAIDNQRLIERVGRLPKDLIVRVQNNVKIVFDL